jgi:hypothetical protein
MAKKGVVQRKQIGNGEWNGKENPVTKAGHFLLRYGGRTGFDHSVE